MEIHFRLTEQPDGSVRIETSGPDNGGLTSGWSHMTTVTALSNVGFECGGEIVLRLKRERELRAEVRSDPLMQLLRCDCGSVNVEIDDPSPGEHTCRNCGGWVEVQ